MSGGLVRLLALARRIVSLLTWLAVIALLAGIYAFSQLAGSDEPAAALVLLVILIGPPLVLLHFVMLLALARMRFGFLGGSGLLRSLIAMRMLSLGAFMHPWYWLLLVASTFACLAMVPLAIGVAIF
jgi:hypothetical protein